MELIWLPPNYHEVYQLTNAVSIHPQSYTLRSNGQVTVRGMFTCRNRNAADLFMERTPYIRMWRDEDFPTIINFDYRHPANGTIEMIESAQETNCVTFHMYDQEWMSREMFYGLYVKNTQNVVTERLNDYDWLLKFDHDIDFALMEKLANCVYVKETRCANVYVTPTTSHTEIVVANSATTPMQRTYMSIGVCEGQNLLIHPINSIIRPEKWAEES